MQTQPLMNNHAMVRAAVAVRITTVILVLATLLLYPFLDERVAGAWVPQQIGFHVAFGLVLVGGLVIMLQPRRSAGLLLAVRHVSPLLSSLLAMNIIVTSLIALTVLTEWGVIVLMAAAGATMLALGLPRQTAPTLTFATLIRNSPLTFGAVYVVLLIGEVFLRFNPMMVGGGGGGNPALPSLYAGLYTFNSFGLRGDEVSLEALPGVFRILTLGDSYTFGQGVVGDSIYPELLERQLNEHGSTVRFEVVNAGKAGWNTLDELEFLETRGLGFHPDLLILQFFANDIEDIVEGRETRPADDFVRRYVTRPFRRSYMIFALRYRFDGVLSRASGEVEDDNEPSWLQATRQEVIDQGPAWTDFRSALSGIARLAGNAGVPVVAALFPQLGITSDIDANRMIIAAVRAEAEALGMHVIDLTPDLQKLPWATRIVSRIDHHPSGTAHAVAATRLRTELVRHGLIPLP